MRLFRNACTTPEHTGFWGAACPATVCSPTSPLLQLLPLTSAQMIHFAQSFVNSIQSQLEFVVHLNYTCSASSSTEGIHFSFCLWWGHSTARLQFYFSSDSFPSQNSSRMVNIQTSLRLKHESYTLEEEGEGGGTHWISNCSSGPNVTAEGYTVGRGR